MKRIKKKYKVAYMGLIVETRQVLYIGFFIKITIGPLNIKLLGLIILYSSPLL
jgi:hypothetical protein